MITEAKSELSLADPRLVMCNRILKLIVLKQPQACFLNCLLVAIEQTATFTFTADDQNRVMLKIC